MNKLTQQELWEKIKNFALDDSTSSFPFSKKLAKENNWPSKFTHKAMEEYKKFIFLCCISPGGASPSEPVDKVWHLHLTYTQNYWFDFCKNTLQQDIHHHPSKGGSNENEKHRSWYRDTLKLYETTFHSKAPPDIWPPLPQPIEKITEDIYDPGFFRKTVFAFTAVLLLYITFNNLYHTKGQDFLGHYVLICIAALGVIWFTQLHKDKRLHEIVSNNLPATFTAFQMARFLYGSHRSYQSALIDLLKRGIIETAGSDYSINDFNNTNWAKEDNPLLLPLSKNYGTGDVFTYNQGLGLIDTETVLNPGLEKLHRLSKRVDYLKLILPCIVLAAGMARFFQGMVNNKPVGFLVLEMGIFAVFCLMILQVFSYTQTVRKHVENYWLTANNNGYGNDFISNFAILGTASLAGFAEYTALSIVFDGVTVQQSKSASSGSAGCASSGCSGSGGDGGSSCGGGGGCGSGCGGCGG